MNAKSFEELAAELLVVFDPTGARKQRLVRPLMIELFGTPKSGKTTVKDMLKHFFKRNGFLLSTPTEGAEVVEWPKRVEPDYNFQTAEYALSKARELAYGPGHKMVHVAIFDRANMDGVVRMEMYGDKGIITPAERDITQGYYLLPKNNDLFDLHVCLVASPEVAIDRELARAITRKHGETMNPQTLRDLLDAHERIRARLVWDQDPKMSWHDSSAETPQQTGQAVLTAVLAAFERRLKAVAT